MAGKQNPTNLTIPIAPDENISAKLPFAIPPNIAAICKHSNTIPAIFIE